MAEQHSRRQFLYYLASAGIATGLVVHEARQEQRALPVALPVGAPGAGVSAGGGGSSTAESFNPVPADQTVVISGSVVVEGIWDVNGHAKVEGVVRVT